MPAGMQECFLLAIDRLQRGERLQMPLDRPLYDVANGLHELRFRQARNIYRVFYFVQKQEAIYIVHATQKKTRKLPGRDRKLILSRLREI